MAIFSGKIIEAYYTNEENTTIEIIYQDGKKAICHYLEADRSHPDFKDLIREISEEKIQQNTVARNKEAMNQLNRVVAGRMSVAKSETIDHVDSINDFVIGYTAKNHSENLFNLKLKIFELPVVKQNTNTELKDRIRLASTPLDVLVAYKEFVK